MKEKTATIDAGGMDARVAKGIAANIRIIAESTARVAVIDAAEDSIRYSGLAMEQRGHDCEAIDKAQRTIAEWLQQPMTWR